MRVVSTQPYGPGTRDDARVVGRMAAIASIGAGMVHVAAAADHGEIPVMMAGFEAVAILQVALGCVLLWRLPSRTLLAAGLALMLASIALWAVSRTVGLGFIEGAHAEPVGFRDSVTVLFELVACVGLWELLVGARRPAAPPGFPGSPVTVLGVAAIALGVPAVITGGHTHTGGHAGAALVHAGGGHADSGRDHDSNRGHSSGRGHAGDSAHDAPGGAPGHDGHTQLASTGSAHAGHGTAVAGGASPHAHATAPASVHAGHPGSAPGTTHGAATGEHGAGTGSGHDPSPGGGTPPSHGGDHPPAPEPAPPAPEPEPTLTDAVANEIDKLVPGRGRGPGRR